MYDIVLAIHNVNRWIVLAMAVAGFARALRWWLADRAAPLPDGGWLAAALRNLSGIQALLGIVLFLALSPLTRLAWESPSQAGSNEVVRFWVIVHGPAMLLAVALIHLHERWARRGLALACLGLAVALLLGAMPWPHLTYGRDLLPSW
jgi:hypothetical protein